MQWQKAGRPKKSKQVKTIKEKKWTKEELSIQSKPFIALASAVIKQWKLDGQPNDSFIDVWIKLLNELKASRDAKESRFNLSLPKEVNNG